MAKKNKKNEKTVGGFAYQAISQPDRRQEKTNVALPNDENVTRAKNFVDENHK